MGIDNSSYIIFGMLLSYEEFLKILKSFMTEEEDDEDFENFYYGYIENGDRFSEKYPGLKLGMSHPYFDSTFDQRVYYLSLTNRQEEIEITECLHLINTHKQSPLKLCADDYGLEYADPKFISVVNVT